MATKDYSTYLQKLFLEIMLSDAQCFVRVQNIFDSINFDRSLRSAADFVIEYSKKYNNLPTIAQVKAETGTALDKVDGLDDTMTDWFLDEFESFTRHETLKRVILKSADLIEKGEYDPIEKLVKDAVQISLTRDLGIDYFEDPRARLSALKDNNGQMSTGWPTLDRKLFGGFNRGELEIFAGGSGAGKSLFMQNLAVNWMQDGKSGVYITLELSENLCSMRIDSMTTGIPTRDIFKDLDGVEMKVKMLGKKAGKLRIKYMPAQSNVNDIRSYLKELQIQTGLKCDYVCVDYLDLLMPVSAKVSPSDLFVKDKYVSEELRNLAKEFDMIVVTASQLNRASVEEVEFDHSHISGGISKINTADNVFGIFTTRSMRETGRYQLQLMKTRSSSGVGQKVELSFDVDSLRIVDAGEEDGYSPPPNSTVYDTLKKKSTVKTPHDNDTNSDLEANLPKVKADVQSTKLKSMLAGLKSS
jgi:archaellum biogenesis ATPase FlaH